MDVGLTKLKVPLKKNELTWDKIVEFLPNIMQAHDQNSNKIKKSYETYKGKHQILQKVRPFSDSSSINNQIIVQDLWQMVNFKCGYIYGNPLEFAEKGTAKTEQIKVFNNHLISVDFRDKIQQIAEYVYACGVGYMFIEPIMVEDKQNFAPYKILTPEPAYCCKVYSSYLDSEALFDIIVTPISKTINEKIQDYNIYSIYTENEYFEFESSAGLYNFANPEKIEERAYKLLPLIEFSANKDKISIVESCVSLQNAIDRLYSDSLDNIEDFVNQMLVLINTSFGKSDEEKQQNLQMAKKNGVIELADPSKDIKADIKTLTIQLNNSEVNAFKNQIKADMYSAWGVPLSTSSVSSGNITQGGGEIANGWENAYSVALKENNKMLVGINDLIKHILWIYKSIPDVPVSDLALIDIEVKYNIARSNNLQVKTQSFVNLVEKGVPFDIAWATCELSGDPNAIGKIIQEHVDELEQKQIAQQTAELKRVQAQSQNESQTQNQAKNENIDGGNA